MSLKLGIPIDHMEILSSLNKTGTKIDFLDQIDQFTCPLATHELEPEARLVLS